MGVGGGGEEINEQIRPKNSPYKLDYDCVTLCERNKTSYIVTESPRSHRPKLRL